MSPETEISSLTLFHPAHGDAPIVKRIAEFLVNLLVRPHLPDVILAPKGRWPALGNRREERPRQIERRGIQLVPRPYRLPQHLSAGLAVTIDKIPADPQSVGILHATGDKRRHMRLWHFGEDPATVHRSPADIDAIRILQQRDQLTARRITEQENRQRPQSVLLAQGVERQAEDLRGAAFRLPVFPVRK